MITRRGRFAPESTTVAGLPDPGRRRFVLCAGAAGLLYGLGPRQSAGASGHARGLTHLRGNDFDLTVSEAPVWITGRRRPAVAVNGSLPAPVLHWREGDTVTIRVTNRLEEPTSIHWHGIILPTNMDGVPGLSFPGIAPGETFVYQFPVRQAGTYWYHSHSGHQEQLGHYGALVIHPAKPETVSADQDHVVVLSDWTDERPERVVARLKKQADYYNFNQPTLGDLVRDVREQGLQTALSERAEWGRMRMNRTDLADVTGYTYTYLMNGQAPAENWTALCRPGERVRLRFVNAGAMTYFDVRIPGLKMTVIRADGQPVRPVEVDEFRIAPAENFDVLVTAEGAGPWTIFAQSMDRTGFARGTLATQAGLSAPIPALDPPLPLTMADMGHDMSHGNHTGHDTGQGAGEHAGHGMPATNEHAGHDMAAMPGAGGVTHGPAEYGPFVDMIATNPVNRLDDPGLGLRDNGRRVLTYADLYSADPDPDGREPARTVELHLTGHMERYVWSINGIRYSDAEPIRLRQGERVRFVVVNDGMMAHPIHLHGLWSDLEDAEGRFKVRKHTISVKPGERLSWRVTADALGRWAMHCHLMLHMELGMFREVAVDG